MFLLPAFTRLGHGHQDVLSPYDEMHVCTEYASVCTLIRKNFRGMGSEATLTPREKSPLPEKKKKKISPEEDRTHDTASGRTASPTHYQRAIPAPEVVRDEQFLEPLPYRSPGASIIEADDRQVTTVFTVQLSFHHRHSTNPVS